MSSLIEKLKDLVNGSEMARFEKTIMLGHIERWLQDDLNKEEDRSLVQQVTNEKCLSEILISTDHVKIYTVSGKDEWSIKYPYRSIFLNQQGIWQRSTTVSPSLDSAYLVYLEKKHLGQNSQFADFACKMLDIKTED